MFHVKVIPPYLLVSSLLLSFNTGISAQALSGHHCQVHHTEASDRFENWLTHQQNALKFRSDEILQIPVVVHIIHNGEPAGEGSNISDEQIHSQIRVLNEDFRRAVGTRGFNEHPDGGDAKIEFILAKSDPDGQATTGITRIDRNTMESPGFGGSMIALGAFYNVWDPSSYLNIWAFPGFQDTGLGEARFPISDLPGHETGNEFTIPGIDMLHGIPVEEIDGIAINTVHFGETSINSVYNLGRTGTHEVGHFLGLFHIWGDEGFEGSCDIDDYCEDTPLVAQRTSGCPLHKQACDGSKAMIENYMDYTNDACMNIFTNDQIHRMRTVLQNSPRRKSLLTSKGLLSPDEIVDTENPFESEINIYPNPFSRDINIDGLPTGGAAEIVISISTIHGQVIKQEVMSTSGSRIELNLSSGKRQVLLIEIRSGDFRVVRRVVQL